MNEFYINTKSNGKHKTMKDIEREYMHMLLSTNGKDKKKAAQAMGFTVKTLYNKMHENGLIDQFCGKSDEQDV